jgi:hypothetical protein
MSTPLQCTTCLTDRPLAPSSRPCQVHLGCQNVKTHLASTVSLPLPAARRVGATAAAGVTSPRLREAGTDRGGICS